jgi:predicted phosphate transport protein (TIGR00153 family)
MKLDHLIQILLPHDEKFYAYFEESAQNVVDASKVLLELRSGSAQDHLETVRRIHEMEHKGDNVTHKIFAELNATFVTPFDREDIHILASALDDVLDYIDGSAQRFVLYKLKNCPAEMARLIEILHRSVNELQKGVSLLRDFRKSAELQKVLERVNEYENEADGVFQGAIADLFEHEKDAVQIIKLKEIYVGLETATDKCEDAANVMESLLIKHA